jgi:hypothetical protein
MISSVGSMGCSLSISSAARSSWPVSPSIRSAAGSPSRLAILQ